MSLIDESSFKIAQTSIPDGEITLGIIELLAEVMDMEPTEVDPLYDEGVPLDFFGDPALQRGTWETAFEYKNYVVQVTSEGYIAVYK